VSFEPVSGLPVLYRDRDVLAVNKPSGLLSVPGKGPDKADCAQSRIQTVISVVYAAHRLDMATSGVLLFALRRKAEAELHRQFRERLVEKRYVARVAGRVTDDEGVITAPLSAITAEGRSVVDPEGKAAETRFRVIERTADGDSLLWLWPRTGRSHQLRVHLAHIGHPIVGDRFYAPEAVAARSVRLLLHAAELNFFQPYSGERIAVCAEAPFP
jgi:tRNA pseudouridine32 synthase/23S rRNA pseudouridine746 synthase